MSDAKALPDNLKELEENAEFKRVYKQFTIAQFEDKLTEAGVSYLSGDDKGDLTWRWLDHEGYDFEAGEYKTDENQDDTTSDKEDASGTSSASDDASDSAGSDANATGGSDSNDTSSGDTDPVTQTEKGVNKLSTPEFVEVKNNGGFSMLEPATGTLVRAGKTTKVYIKGYATKDQVLRNINQYNQTRGKKLTVTN